MNDLPIGNGKTCLVCGEELIQHGRGRPRMYCSVDCRREMENENRRKLPPPTYVPDPERIRRERADYRLGLLK